MWLNFFLPEARIARPCSFMYYFIAICLGIQTGSTDLYAQGVSIKTTESFSFNKQDSAYIMELLHTGRLALTFSVDSAKSYYLEAYALCRDHAPYAIKGEVCAQLAWLYWLGAQYDSSIAFCKEAIEIEKTLHRELQLLHLYCKLSSAYSSKGTIHMSLLTMYSALGLIWNNDRLRYTKQAAIVYEQMAHIWASLGEEKQKHLYLDTAYEISKNIKDTFTRVAIYMNKAINTSNASDRNSLLRETLALCRQSGNKRQEAICLMYLGTSAESDGKIREAFYYLEKALRIRDKAGPVSGGLQLVPNFYMARAYYTSRQYNVAEKLLLEVITKAELMQDKEILRETHRLISKVYAAKRQYEEAYKHNERYQELLDSTRLMEKDKTLQFLLHYQSLEKDRDIAQKELLITRQQKNLQQKNFWIGGISLGLLLSGALLVALYRTSRHKQRLQKAAILNLTQQQQIDQLRALMEGEEKERNRIARELHDGIGSQIAAARMHLDIFKDSTAVPDYAKTYKTGLHLLDEAYKGLRYTAHNLLPGQLLERGLLPVLQEYCKKISRPGLLTIHFQSFGRLPQLAADKALSIYRIVQELIHNALKHAEATDIIVEVDVEEHYLSLSVEDNGLGWKTPGDIPAGIGLDNLKQRISLLDGTLEIDSRQGIGTTVYLSLPLKEITL